MGGFANIKALSEALSVNGQGWQSTYRKALATGATVAGQWYDYAYAGGNPVANYYAAAPLESARLDGRKGIWLPTMDTGYQQWLHRWSVMVTGATSSNQTLMLLDYVLAYPFVDMDAAGTDQVMTQTDALPRYTDGLGLQMMCVAQSTTVGGGRFTVTYTGTDDVQYTTPSLFCGTATVPGALVHAVGAAGGACPFLPLNAGVKGVKSVQSVNFSVANGGLMALVLVKPLARQWLRDTAGASTGDVGEWEAVRSGNPTPEIKSGAFLGIIGQGTAGSLASAVLTGMVETVWSV